MVTPFARPVKAERRTIGYRDLQTARNSPGCCGGPGGPQAGCQVSRQRQFRRRFRQRRLIFAGAEVKSNFGPWLNTLRSPYRTPTITLRRIGM